MSKIKVLGLIPARGGSKGLPKKNLYLFNKKPLIQWTIESALESNSLDRIIVNTDDESIADFSRSKGVEVPFLREPHLAQDDSRIVDAVLNVLEKLIDFNLISI